MSDVTGIVWIGPVYDRGGYGTVARNYLVGLAELSYPVRVVPIGPEHGEIDSKARATIKAMERADPGRLPLVVAHGTPDLHREVNAWGAAGRVLMTLFETDGLPAGWAEGCNRFDEVWVPSRFNQDTFARAGVAPDKLWVVPYAIDTTVFRTPTTPPARPAERPFTFLYVFSFGWRKGFDVMLRAFFEEFGPGEARLILRCFTQGYQGVEREQVADTLLTSAGVDLSRSDLPEVEISLDALSTAGLIELYRSCDLYISTDRGNGWGYPNMEAMAVGVPSAAIDWGGGVEFMTEENSFLLRTEDEFEPVDDRLAAAVPLLYGGQRWKRLAVDEVRRVMRRAHDDPVELARIAVRGCVEVHRDFNAARVAQRIVDHAATVKAPARQRLRAGLRLPTMIHLALSRQKLREMIAR